MRVKLYLTTLGYSLLLVALMATSCSKVREPKPEPTTKVIDASGKAHQLNGPPPVITCEKAEYDFGTVTQGEDATHVFVIKNTGKGVLKIERARGG